MSKNPCEGVYSYSVNLENKALNFSHLPKENCLHLKVKMELRGVK